MISIKNLFLSLAVMAPFAKAFAPQASSSSAFAALKVRLFFETFFWQHPVV